MTALALPASVTFADVATAGKALAAPAGAAWQVDAGALRNFDSSAIALLLEWRRRALAAGGRFSVKGAPATMVALATLYGVAELLAFEPA